MSSAKVELGKLVEDMSIGRDAIHIAVIPVIAAEKLYPSQKISCNDLLYAVSDNSDRYMGIVDPFLTSPLFKEDKFYMMLKQDSITGLKHVWSHPIIDSICKDRLENEEDVMDDTSRISDSMIWMRNFAKKLNMTYSSLMLLADNMFEGENYKIDSNGNITDYGGEDARDLWYSESIQFWIHYAIIRNLPPIKETDDLGGFSCAC